MASGGVVGAADTRDKYRKSRGLVGGADVGSDDDGIRLNVEAASRR